MLSWFKTKIWQPIKGFFKDFFGFTALEKELAQARKDTKEVLDLYDNLTEGNRELITRFNRVSNLYREESLKRAYLAKEQAMLQVQYKALFVDIKSVKSDYQDVRSMFIGARVLFGLV